MYHKQLDEFPDSFLWGAASAAYQIEGASNSNGKGLSIWDEFSHLPNKTYKNTNGDVAVDHYNKYNEDIMLMSNMNLKAYRFSISWSRIIPDGDGEINPEGLNFYDNLINSLIENGIEPIVTTYHWDLPLSLQKKYNGWEGRDTIEAYVNYCEILFERYGSKVKYWITMNEQNVFISMGYRWQSHPPGINNLKKMYQANHHVNLANAKAIQLFREKKYEGQIGPSFGYGGVYPESSNPLDCLAAENADEFNNKWWLDVYCKGEYPKCIMKKLSEMDIAPDIENGDMDILKNATPDFIGINYYHGGTVGANHFERKKPTITEEFCTTDPYLINPRSNSINPEDFMFTKVENPFLKKTDWNWEIDPIGFRYALRKVFSDYQLPIFVTENGLGAFDNLEENNIINDTYRIEYLQSHILEMKKTITDGVEILGYCAWSFTDLLSWLNGYKKRYGFVYIDRTDNDEKKLERIPKQSFFWYRDLIKSNGKSIQ